MKRIVFFIFFISLLFSQEIQKIDFSKTILQVGAFKKASSLLKIKKRLSSYNLLTKKVDGFTKLFVLNPTKNDIKKIKKIIPNAFILSQNAKNKIFKNTTKKLDIPIINLNYNSDKKLNTQTIIKTRKKFFK